MPQKYTYSLKLQKIESLRFHLMNNLYLWATIKNSLCFRKKLFNISKDIPTIRYT